MLSKLPPRERQIVDVLYERGPMLVSVICEALPDQLSGSAVRAMLKRLEDKGFVQRADSDRGYLYSPTVSDTVAKKSALTEIVRVFFNGAFWYEALHMFLAAYVVAGFVVAGVYAAGMLKGRRDAYHRLGFPIGFDRKHPDACVLLLGFSKLSAKMLIFLL